MYAKPNQVVRTFLNKGASDGGTKRAVGAGQENDAFGHGPIKFNRRWQSKPEALSVIFGSEPYFNQNGPLPLTPTLFWKS
jgi:hypothetical protein